MRSGLKGGASGGRLRGATASLILCGPAVALYGGFIVLPALLGFAYSLTDWTGWTGTPDFIGLANFRELCSDTLFFKSVRFTLFETAMIVVFFTFFSMALAVLLDKLRVWKGLIRGLFFYPYVLSIIVSALLFTYLANYREGAVNLLLRALHLDMLAQDWMADRALAPYFIFTLVAWSGLGFFTTLYLANLQTIPGELYEAARIDGAGPLSVFSRIQFPMLLPTVTTNSVLALITGINLFPQIVVTTQGGPGFDTFTIGYYIYHLGYQKDRLGYAAAVSFMTFAALVAVAAVQVAVLRRRQVSL
ncbi:MAG: sugar ABC transporter permease [Candidatus Hydrogenedentes bacterium]|nr:sugar ABC transporter permease [Candidatus Hydrogenedentota bacterium]